MNPMIQIMQMIRLGQNPQQLVINLLSQSASSSPMGQNLLSLAQNHDGATIEKIARNICASRGLDFDKEFTAFKQQWKL